MIIDGKKIRLEPMTEDEVPQFYYWAIRSPFWYGEYSDEREIPSYEKFRENWPNYYFDGSRPDKGRSFSIIKGERTIGQVNYNEIDKTNRSVDIDIIIFQESDRAKGYGSDALKALCDYLFSNMEIEKVQLETAVNNERAINSYKKIGFKVIGPTISKGVKFLKMELNKRSIVKTG